eukprot:scaffold201076_cov40-Prasinocladus_malaysianus.AAC.1
MAIQIASVCPCDQADVEIWMLDSQGIRRQGLTVCCFLRAADCSEGRAILVLPPAGVCGPFRVEPMGGVPAAATFSMPWPNGLDKW